MNKELLTIESELQRLNENLNLVRQIRHRLETRVFALDFPKEHYTETIGILINKKASFLSLYSGYFGSERNEIESEIINLSPETKMLHNELKTAYKETADYITELITIAKEKAENTESKEALKERKKAKPQMTLTETQKDFLIKIIPEINDYVAENSTFEQWEKVFTAQEPSNKIKIKCSNKLLAELITKIKRKFNLNIADAFFSNCFEGNKPISHRFIGVGTSRPPTDEDRNKLEEIFKAVQK